MLIPIPGYFPVSGFFYQITISYAVIKRQILGGSHNSFLYNVVVVLCVTKKMSDQKRR